MKRYYIAWRSLITNYRGRGTQLMSKETAENNVETLNRRLNRLFYHWIEIEEQ